MRQGYLLLLFLLHLAIDASGQSHNYWVRSFNEESSLLSGAVVGGGSGPSAIYYNPASIDEVVSVKFSLNASLFSFTWMNLTNAFGDNIGYSSIKAKAEPRFLSYMLKPKKYQKWSLEAAFLNTENEKGEMAVYVDERNNVLAGTPVDDRYTAFYQYSSRFRDDWVGFGASLKANKWLCLGVSMFAAFKTIDYTKSIDIQAYPLYDSTHSGDFYAAGYQDNYYLSANDYRLLWKIGLTGKWDNVSVGITVTTPSIGVYSDGKRVQRTEQQSNITNPETGQPIADYLITDYAEAEEVHVSYNTPFSVAAGLTWMLPGGKRILYLSMEYFTGISPYRMVETEESDYLQTGSGGQENDDWLTYSSGAKPVFNVAMGYSWTLSDKLLLKAGFRTDFNYQKNFDFGEFSEVPRIEKMNLDLYYLTCGLKWNLFGQDIITGLQYSTGRNSGKKQIINLSDPVEYNFTEQKPLQGTRLDNMTMSQHSVVIYLGFSLNFGDKAKP